jgi:hypothetical protein
MGLDEVEPGRGDLGRRDLGVVGDVSAVDLDATTAEVGSLQGGGAEQLRSGR